MQLTEQSRRAICDAQVAAGEAGRERIEPEHLLLAILRDDHCGAWLQLQSQNGSPDVICEEVAAQFDQRQPDGARKVVTSPDQVVLSPDAVETVEAAAKIASAAGRHFLGPEHILAALILHPTRMLAPIWARYHVTALHVSDDLSNQPPHKKRHERNHVSPAPLARSTVWDRFTPAAKNAVLVAQNETLRSGLSEVSPLFLLSGVLQEEDTVVSDALTWCGVERNVLRTALLDLLPARTDASSVTEVTLDPLAKMAVDRSFELARRLGDNHVGTEHLFLGLLDFQTDAGNILRTHGLTTGEFINVLQNIERAKTVPAQKRKSFGVSDLMWVVLIAAILGWLCQVRSPQ